MENSSLSEVEPKINHASQLWSTRNAALLLRLIHAVRANETGELVSHMKRLRANLACDGFVDPRITDANFPGARADADSAGVRPVRLGSHFFRDGARDKLEAMATPMEFARLDECMHWAAKHPNAQRDSQLLCLAQVWVDGNGVEHIVTFLGLPTVRELYLDGTARGWDSHCLILAKPKNLSLILKQ